MRRLIAKRLTELAVTMFSATLVIFFLTRLAPGDPVEMLFFRGAEFAAVDKNVFDEKKAELRKEYGLDENIGVQYIRWITRLAKLDFGKSIYTERQVSYELAQRFPATLLLALVSLVILLLFGLLFGILSALHRGGVFDNIVRFFCVMFASIPGFVLGLGLLAFFSVTLKLYTVSGGLSVSNVLLPAFVIALTLAPQLIRIVRANMLAETGQIYVLSARSRGLDKKRVIKHALRNALLPIVTLLGLSLSAMVGGSIVIESIFAYPGIGKYALDSILLHDYPIIQAYAVLMTFSIIVINMTVDILYFIIDPKIRKKGAAFNDAKNDTK
jgi:peptide/nickel transport system permease protein